MAENLTNMDLKVAQLQELVTTQPPEKADAIIWLQGNGYDRGAKVLELYQAGYAPIIVITGNNVRVVEEDTVKISDLIGWLEEHGVARSALVVDDQAMNTLDQAVRVIAMAKARAWGKILLVGSTHHQLRAFLTFLKVAGMQGWSGKIINQPVMLQWNQIPSGRKDTVAGAFKKELEKIDKYADDLATVGDALRYLNSPQLI